MLKRKNFKLPLQKTRFYSPQDQSASKIASSQKLFQKYPPFRFMLAAASFGLISQLIDLEFVEHHFLVLVEELFEMNIALSMLFASCAITKVKAQKGYLDTESSQFNGTASAVDAQSNQIF